MSKNGSHSRKKVHSKLGTMSKKGRTKEKQGSKRDLAKTKLEMANIATRVLLDDTSGSQTPGHGLKRQAQAWLLKNLIFWGATPLPCIVASEEAKTKEYIIF